MVETSVSLEGVLRRLDAGDPIGALVLGHLAKFFARVPLVLQRVSRHLVQVGVLLLHGIEHLLVLLSLLVCLECSLHWI